MPLGPLVGADTIQQAATAGLYPGQRREANFTLDRELRGVAMGEGRIEPAQGRPGHSDSNDESGLVLEASGKRP